MKKFAVVIVAAGRSQRFGDPLIKKPFASINGKAIWLHSAERFVQRSDVGQVVIVVAADDRQDFLSTYAANLAVWGFDVVAGGAQRSESVRNGVAAVKDSFEWVAIHDAARPCLDDALIDRVFAAASQSGNAIPAVPVTSTVKRSKDGKSIDSTCDRSGLYLAQTPQVFQRAQLIAAMAAHAQADFTDESQLMETAGHSIALVEGSLMNIKITNKDDIAFATNAMKSATGIRFDAPPKRSDNLFWR